ncbi:MAG TPA: C39 family peptidase, partial [Rectinemataceae bacterium]|nr:C39 family peptidase [Rectinemataceae bacterium]
AAMALEYLGFNLPTAFVAADCYDAGAKIFGNWPFNVASLWRLGARTRLDYFANAEMAAAELQAGHLLIASIRFGHGELTDAPISKTNGHLVLITGLARDATGAYRILVNDPAASGESEVKRSYDLAEFEKAWTGVAYVIEGRR